MQPTDQFPDTERTPEQLFEPQQWTPVGSKNINRPPYPGSGADAPAGANTVPPPYTPPTQPQIPSAQGYRQQNGIPGAYPQYNAQAPMQNGAVPPQYAGQMQNGAVPPQYNGQIPMQNGTIQPQFIGQAPMQNGTVPPQYNGQPPMQNGTVPPQYNGQIPVQDRTASSGTNAQTQTRVYMPDPENRYPSNGLKTQKKSKRWLLYVAIAAILAVGVFIWTNINRSSGKRYAYITSDTVSTVYTGNAMIVRNETLYTQEGATLIDQKVLEGTNVTRADLVCVVYTAGFNTKEFTTLENYRNQIKEYHKTLLSSSSTKDLKLSSYETSVLSKAMAAQAIIQGDSRGSLTDAENELSSAMQDRQIYLKQKFPDDQKLARLYDDENAQLQKISSWAKQYPAVADGIVSFYTDGYENVLNLYNYNEYTPAQVRNMYDGMIPTDESVTKNTVSIYRLVRSGQWVVLMLCDNKDWTPLQGSTYKLTIESFNNTTVDAIVESTTQSGGELLVRLVITGDINIGNIMYTRACSVRLSESVNSLMVPANAIYTKNGRTGVVLVTDGIEYWTPVDVISSENNMVQIMPLYNGVLYEGIPVLLF